MKIKNRVIVDKSGNVVARATSFNLAWIEVAKKYVNASTDFLQNLREEFQNPEEGKTV